MVANDVDGDTYCGRIEADLLSTTMRNVSAAFCEGATVEGVAAICCAPLHPLNTNEKSRRAIGARIYEPPKVVVVTLIETFVLQPDALVMVAVHLPAALGTTLNALVATCVITAILPQDGADIENTPL